MVTVAGVKIKSKAFKTRDPKFHDEKYTGSEPVWDTEAAKEYSDELFDHNLRQSFYYYNYYYTQKDCRKYVIDWMKNSSFFTKTEVSAFIRTGDRSIPMTACSLIMAHKNGMPFRTRHTDFLIKVINEAIADVEPEVIAEINSPTALAYKPTIQDRMNEKTADTIGELEGHYDDTHVGKKYSFNTYEFLVSNSVPQSQLGKYEAKYMARKAELEAAKAGADAQLKEGYSNYKAADFKRLIAAIDDILQAIEQYRGVKRATKKARVTKAPSKEKQIAKLKYAKDDKALKLVSVAPATILGSKELWIFNTKTRKIGCYVADELTGPLSVKGTTIVGFNETKSVSKTLRKPEAQLKEFAKCGKVQLRTFIKDIKATETKLNGRINADIILLKVQ